LDVVNDADVGVIGRRRVLRLTQESLLRALVVTPLRREELQRDGAPELGVRRLVDHTHAAATKLRDDVVLADRRADERVGHRAVRHVVGVLYHRTTGELPRPARPSLACTAAERELRLARRSTRTARRRNTRRAPRAPLPIRSWG